MNLKWDESKYERNLRIHRLDFGDAYDFEWETADIKQTYASRTGRPREKATGWLHSRLVTLVYSRLGTEAYSIISLRPASRLERKRYAER